MTHNKKKRTRHTWKRKRVKGSLLVLALASALTLALAGQAAASPQYTLTVHKDGVGSGTVASSPDGIVCGSTCSHAFDVGTTVTLMASGANGSAFAGWSGACSGIDSCEVTMGSDQDVTATFVTSTPPVSVRSLAERCSLLSKKLKSAKTKPAKKEIRRKQRALGC
jgi:List-Bact-rpt repeat protein